MPVPHQHVLSQLRQLIYYHLDCNLLRNALFFAGRLHAYEPRSPEAAYLLALCHLRMDQYKAAYDSCKILGSRGTHLGCAYVFAQACLALEKHGEGVTALERSRALWSGKSNWNQHTEHRRDLLPDASAVHCLMGKLLHAYEDTDKAVECYAEALRLNPFMWDAFLGLCDLGVNVKVPNIFKLTQEMATTGISAAGDEAHPGIFDDSSAFNLTVGNVPAPSAPSDPFAGPPKRMNRDYPPPAAKAALYERLNASTSVVTPINSTIQGLNEANTPTAPGPAVLLPAARPKEAPVLTSDIMVEPPQAPMRRIRPPAGFVSDLDVDAPPRLKPSSLRSRIRAVGDSDEAEPMLPTLLTGAGDRKRTASGRIPESSIPQSSGDHLAPQQRRSVRLFNNAMTRPQSSKFSAPSMGLAGKEGREIKKPKSTASRSKTAPVTIGRAVSWMRKQEDADESKETKAVLASASTSGHTRSGQERVREQEALATLLDLLLRLGRGYYQLSKFRCQEALADFGSVPHAQRETPWVLAQMGRAAVEQSQYGEAVKLFERMRGLAPASLEELDLYSTALWFRKDEVNLAFLAHELMGTARLSPVAWVAAGNSFSAQNEHDQAIRCFRRATQLEPAYAYAFTLQGHEHVSNEEYDKAVAAYRNAITADHRHYNAWYGLGKVYEKQGKFDMAEQHYRTAACINPTNAVLLCCIGSVLERLKRPQHAFEFYTRSIELAPAVALARYRRARVLAAMGRAKQALDELLVLRNMSPDEANVHFLLGQVCKKLHRKADAVKHFTTAVNLDPKVRVALLGAACA